ncbi:gluconate 2-dehydrogenase subunit 3 family protein [Frateuria aurantia]
MSLVDPPASRRRFLRTSLSLLPAVSLAGCTVSPSSPATDRTAGPASGAAQPDYHPRFFNDGEWAFVQAAVARLIPKDHLGAGALEAGVPEFIDRQMQTPYATGALWYMQGPFDAAAPPSLGYQLKLVPQQVYRLGIAGLEAAIRQSGGHSFAALSEADQEAWLKKLESGAVVLDSVPAKTFFALLLQNTREGFFCDPIHGGNRGMVGWTLVGFPGARADFMDWVERNEAYPFPPVSIDGARG